MDSDRFEIEPIFNLVLAIKIQVLAIRQGISPKMEDIVPTGLLILKGNGAARKPMARNDLYILNLRSRDRQTALCRACLRPTDQKVAAYRYRQVLWVGWACSDPCKRALLKNLMPQILAGLDR